MKPSRIEALRRFFVLVISMMYSTYLVADPVNYSIRRNIQLADGATISVYLCGNEHFHYYQDTSTGKCYIDTADGYTEIGQDERNRHLQRARESARANYVQNRNFFQINQLVGRKRMLLIPAQFSDTKFSTFGDTSELEELYNTIGYSGDKASGSVRDYYREQSHGLLDLVFDVAQVVTLSGTHDQYGTNTESGSIDSKKSNDMVEECVRACDGKIDKTLGKIQELLGIKL